MVSVRDPDTYLFIVILCFFNHARARCAYKLPLVPVSKSLREECTAERLFVSYEGLTGAVSVGSAVLLDDGLVSVRVTDVRQDFVTGLVENSGVIKSRRGVNLPGAKVDLPALSDKDKIDIRQVFIHGHCMRLSMYCWMFADV